MFDWNDLKYLLALGQHKSTMAAARALSVNQSTVQRRLAELERCLGQALVRRHANGYRMTSFAEQLLPLARQVEHSVLIMAQHIQSGQRQVSGVVRLTCPEALVSRLTESNLLDRFHANYPGLQVVFVGSDKFLDFKSDEADIALRSGDSPDETLVARKVGDTHWAVYASRKYLARRGQPKSVADLEQHDWVGYFETMSQHRSERWQAQVAPTAHIVIRHHNVLGHLYSVKSGIGLAPLPTVLGDAEPDLVRVLGPIPELAGIWRLVTTPELRRTPRVAALFDFLVAEVEALRPIICG